MPYLIDEEYNTTEAEAIQRYICNCWSSQLLLGKDIKDKVRLERFLSIFTEISTAIKELFFSPKLEISKGEVLGKYGEKLEELTKSIGGEYVMGYLTLADFVVAEDSYCF